MRFLTVSIFLLGSVMSTMAFAQKPLLTFFTADVNGTYFVMGADIEKACPMFSIHVESTEGSLANINFLIKSPVVEMGHRFAMVQRDVLTIIPQNARKNKLKEITTIFNEEIIVIVNKKSKIESLSDLHNKRVSVGLPYSGNWVSANIIKNKMQIKWLAVEKPVNESILEVLTGELDAMFLVSGTPNKMLRDISPSMNAYIKIIPITNTFKMYSPATINEDAYEWQNNTINTVSTEAVLITANDVPDAVANEVLICINASVKELRKYGHRKWREVEILKRVKNE